MKDLAAYVEAIGRGGDPDHVCQMCGENYDCEPDAEPSALCNQCAHEATDFLPDLLHLARVAMIPERDAHDQYDAWHDRLLKLARAAVRARGVPSL